MRRLFVAAGAALLAAGCVTPLHPTTGDSVYVVRGTAPITPAGKTLNGLDKIRHSLLGSGAVPFEQLYHDGDVVLVARCAHGRVLATGSGGEQQLRLDTGTAVWVDRDWVFRKPCR